MLHLKTAALVGFLVKLECVPMPNVTAALPDIRGTLCSTPQSFADGPTPTTRVKRVEISRGAPNYRIDLSR